MMRIAARRDDGGFTLIEVVVATLLMAIVFSAVSIFFVRGISTATSLQRRDNAAQVADQAMQLVRAVPAETKVITNADGTTTTELTRLVRNRTQAAVQAQWASAPAALANTTPVWDPAPAVGAPTSPVYNPAHTPAAANPAVPLTLDGNARPQVGGIRYTVDTFIGSCTQPADGSPCTNATGTVGVEAYRIVVRVRWSEGQGTSCSGQPCEYLATTLIDTKGDLLFNTQNDQPRPVALPDTVTAQFESPVTFNVLRNDSGGLRPSPVSITQAPSSGTFVGGTASGTITFQPAPGFVGTVTFRYKITDTSDLTSDAAVVTITVANPAIAAVGDTSSVYVNRAVDIDVLANDTARNPQVSIVSGPSGGTAVVQSDGRIRFTANGTAGSSTFTYRVTDVVGQTRDASVTVTKLAAPTAANDTLTAVYPGNSIDVRANDQGPLRTGVVTLTGGASSTLGTATVSNGVVTFTPALGRTGTQAVTYSVTADGFTASATLTVTVNAPASPTATTFQHCVPRNQVSTTIDLSARVTGVREGGTYSFPSSVTSYTVTSVNTATGAVVLRATTNTATARDVAWTFTDAWGRTTASRNVQLRDCG